MLAVDIFADGAVKAGVKFFVKHTLGNALDFAGVKKGDSGVIAFNFTFFKQAGIGKKTCFCEKIGCKL